MLNELFPQSTGTQYLAQLHHTLTLGLQTRDLSPFQPDPIDTAARDNMALARATQAVLANSIRKSWYCINAIIRQERDPEMRTDPASLSQILAGNPESMRANGLYLLVALKAPIQQDVFNEMARRYYQSPEPDIVPPDSRAHSELLHAATKGMQSIRALEHRLVSERADPTLAKALDEARDWKDPRAFLENHPDPRIPLKVAGLQADIPDFLAAVYVVNHYLASASYGNTQEVGFAELEVALHNIQRMGGALPLSSQSTATMGSVLQNIRESLPVQQTVPERFQAILERIQRQDADREATAPKVAASQAPDNNVQRIDTAPQPPQRPKKPKGP